MPEFEDASDDELTLEEISRAFEAVSPIRPYKGEYFIVEHGKKMADVKAWCLEREIPFEDFLAACIGELPED